MWKIILHLNILAYCISPVLQSLIGYQSHTEYITKYCLLNGLALQYLTNHLIQYKPPTPHRSTNTGLLIIFQIRIQCGEAAF